MIHPFPNGRVDDHEWISFDTETTGLHPGARPIEIGAVRMRGCTVIDSFCTLVDPDVPIPKEASAVHGLTNADVKGAASMGEALAQLRAFGAGAIWIAHNAGYDVGILTTAAIISGEIPPDAPVLDSWRLARACLPGQPTYRLDALGPALGLATEGFHRALADAQVTAGLFEHCVRAIGPPATVEVAELTRRAGGHLTVAGAVFAATDLPPGLEKLQAAVDLREPITMLYQRENEQVRVLRVSPRLLFRRGEKVYMEAFCFDGRYLKSYRADRIVSFEPDPPPKEPDSE